MKHRPAQILREYGPFEGIESVAGVSFDGSHVWIAGGDSLTAIDPESGASTRAIAVAADAGTAFDGRHLFQIAGDRIQKIDPASGSVLGTIPVPGEGGCSGMAWAEGTLWVACYRGRRIHEVDPESGAVLRTLASDRHVTGVTWVEGELWHGTWEDERSELRKVDAASGEVRETIAMPEGITVSGLESDGADRFFCGGGDSGKLRAVRRSG